MATKSIPDDYFIRLNYTDLKLINEKSFEKSFYFFPSNNLSICFWFYPTYFKGIQFIANSGNLNSNQEGWSIFLNDNKLHFRLKSSKKVFLEATYILSRLNKWYFFSGLINLSKKIIIPHLNSSKLKWEINTPNERIVPGLEKDANKLIIGGFTDVAGGHFNYTFGRLGEGFLEDFRIYKRQLYYTEIKNFIKKDNMPEMIFNEKIPHLKLPRFSLPISNVFVNGSEGYSCFRIPALIRAGNGDLLAFSEARLGGCSDSTQIIRIVCKRSINNGLSWEPLKIVAKNIFEGKEYACMNPSPVVDTVFKTNKIILVFNKTEFSEWDIIKGKGITRIFSLVSEDNGHSWINENDITCYLHKQYNSEYEKIYPTAALPENKTSDWRRHAVQPGHAIQLKNTPSCKGRLFYIGTYTIGDSSLFSSNNYAFWSDDLGETWEKGPTISLRNDGKAAVGLNEAMSVELQNGNILINSRNYQDDKIVGQRAITIGFHNNSGQLKYKPTYNDKKLIEPGVQASIINVPQNKKSKSFILFANPNHKKVRKKLTLKLSYDNGISWPISKEVTNGPSSYSDMAFDDNGEIFLVFELGNEGGIVFSKFDHEWITK